MTYCEVIINRSKESICAQIKSNCDKTFQSNLIRLIELIIEFKCVTLIVCLYGKSWKIRIKQTIRDKKTSSQKKGKNKMLSVD
jgi:hypothetical protein